jgi:hypothetical protein
VSAHGPSRQRTFAHVIPPPAVVAGGCVPHRGPAGVSTHPPAHLTFAHVPAPPHAPSARTLPPAPQLVHVHALLFVSRRPPPTSQQTGRRSLGQAQLPTHFAPVGVSTQVAPTEHVVLAQVGICRQEPGTKIPSKHVMHLQGVMGKSGPPSPGEQQPSISATRVLQVQLGLGRGRRLALAHGRKIAKASAKAATADAGASVGRGMAVLDVGGGSSAVTPNLLCLSFFYVCTISSDLSASDGRRERHMKCSRWAGWSSRDSFYLAIRRHFHVPSVAVYDGNLS